MKEQFAKQGLTAMLGTPDETRAFVAGEYKRWGEVIQESEDHAELTARRT